MQPEELPAKFIFGKNNVCHLQAGTTEGSIYLSRELGGEAVAQFTRSDGEDWSLEYNSKEGEPRHGTIFKLDHEWHLQMQPNQERRKLNCRRAASPFELFMTVSNLVLGKNIT